MSWSHWVCTLAPGKETCQVAPRPAGSLVVVMGDTAIKAGRTFCSGQAPGVHPHDWPWPRAGVRLVTRDGRHEVELPSPDP